jgi:probable phosphoglycerate mutase
MTTFYLVRHGETHWNVEKRWQGHLDSSLTERGIQQVETLAGQIKHLPFDAVYSSDLPRAVATAQILTKHLKIELHTSKLLRERDAGPVEGTTAADRATTPHIHDQFNAYLQLKSANKWGKKPFPNFESNQEVALRFEAELTRIAARQPNHHVLVVAHGGNIRNFLAHIGFIPAHEADNFAVSNAALVEVTFTEGVFTAVRAVGVDRKRPGA